GGGSSRACAGNGRRRGGPMNRIPADHPPQRGWKPYRWRRYILLGAFILASGAVLTRAFQLQALEHEKWATEALEQQQQRVPLPARRGAVLDRDGVPLAMSHETF